MSKRWLIAVWLFVTCFMASAGSPGDSVVFRSKFVMFWNVENFFDPFDDSLSLDDEFLPYGEKRWTWKKFLQKRNMVCKTILSVKDAHGGFPVLIGLAEIENYMVLSQLVRDTPLSKLGYGIIHRDSPDRRGIDVALLYREDEFRPLMTEAVPVPNGGRPTRDILHVCGIVDMGKGDTDTADIFVLHFPSKSGGERLTAPLRMEAAGILVQEIRNLLKDRRRNIIVMGDFNDVPTSEPVRYIADSSGLVNMGNVQDGLRLSDPASSVRGTIKYNGKWELIDNFFVNFPAEMIIYNHPALCEEDGKYLGIKPFRTYYGPMWHGGASDHFPILLEIPHRDY